MLPTVRAKSVFWASLLCLSSCLGCATSSLVPSQFAGLSKTSAEESDLPKDRFRRIASQGGRASVLGGRRGIAKQRTHATSHSAL